MPLDVNSYNAQFSQFVQFAELAVNPSIDLSATDSNEVFGLENNPATSCTARSSIGPRTPR